jgi:uncharacterized protein YjbI with pentapeptide repeats
VTDDDKAKIARINELSAFARTSWLALLAFLAYIGITLLAVEDADFFVPSRQTDLPLVGIAISTEAFFWFAPPLAAALYVYLHIHLLKLWDAIAAAPYAPGGMPLSERLHPWLANEFALRLKGNGAGRARPLAWLGIAATMTFVWIAGPFVLFGFWWRSAPAHEPLLTLLIAAMLLLSLFAGLSSLRALTIRLRLGPLYPIPPLWRPASIASAALVALLMLAVSWFRTGEGLDSYVPQSVADSPPIPKWGRLSSAQLANVELVALPAEWRPPEVASRAFREIWCRRDGLAMDICSNAPEPDAGPDPTLLVARRAWCDRHGLAREEACAAHFARRDARYIAEWAAERRVTRAALPALNLTGRDLRGANARQASLVGANLQAARMDGAEFWDANLEASNLSEAALVGARLAGARLEGADLSGVDARGAVFTGAQMQGAQFFRADLRGGVLAWTKLNRAGFSEAKLERASFTNAVLTGSYFPRASLVGADLSNAQVIDADFWGADLRQTRWKDARLSGTTLEKADLRGAVDLTPAQLQNVIGDSDTLLPVEPVLHVSDCWTDPPEQIEARIFHIADGSMTDEEVVRNRLVCDGREPVATGTPCPPDIPREQCRDWAVAAGLVDER